MKFLLIKYNEEIVIGIIVTIVGGLLLTIIVNLFSAIKKKLSQNPLPPPEERAIYLNMPKNILQDYCIGRDRLLEEVYKKIINKELLYTNRHIVITGIEGIGKTLFCQTLFIQYLRYSNIYLGWIDCNGGQSIFDIIKSSIHDPRFYRKSKKTYYTP